MMMVACIVEIIYSPTPISIVRNSSRMLAYSNHHPIAKTNSTIIQMTTITAAAKLLFGLADVSMAFVRLASMIDAGVT